MMHLQYFQRGGQANCPPVCSSSSQVVLLRKNLSKKIQNIEDTIGTKKLLSLLSLSLSALIHTHTHSLCHKTERNLQSLKPLLRLLKVNAPIQKCYSKNFSKEKTQNGRERTCFSYNICGPKITYQAERKWVSRSESCGYYRLPSNHGNVRYKMTQKCERIVGCHLKSLYIDNSL